MSQSIAHVERSAALVASYEVAVTMGHAEAHASLSWLLMVPITTLTPACKALFIVSDILLSSSA
jgi:hypothetical protein